ncbi:hypothetical protein BGX24_001078 [Mortierella sp. AD032]|nr:hypothetical protein BGX24_001078 [Mortierella sp. AD032]
MSSEDKPTVLIVGAGLGGLMLAALLEKSGVPFSVFERATTVKPLGSAMSIGPTLLPIFQQLGVYDELLTIGNARTQIPFWYRVLDITEDDDKVTVHLSSRDKFEGDIIVGADGAYSAVRQRVYEQLKAKGKLPNADQEDLPFSCTCLVGQTDILDPERFPLVALPRSHYNSILGKDKPFSWHTFNTAEGKLCFMVLHHLDSKASKAATEQRFRSTNNAEWGAHPAQAMCDETRDFPLPLGGGKTGTLGDLYDSTPKELISKVMLEEKVFETWYRRRFVLLEMVTCHKLNPAGGHGAVTAMHDAIALANLLYAMPTKTSSDITKIFDEYHKERLPAVMESFNSSQQLSNIFKAGLVGAIYCFLATHMPTWVWRIVMAQTVRYRPQVGFMKRIESKGTIAPVFSPSEQKARDVFENQQQSNNVVAV